MTVTTFRDLNPFCSPIAARGRPLAVHVHESVQTQLAALKHILLASPTVQDQWAIGQSESDKQAFRQAARQDPLQEEGAGIATYRAQRDLRRLGDGGGIRPRIWRAPRHR